MQPFMLLQRPTSPTIRCALAFAENCCLTLPDEVQLNGIGELDAIAMLTWARSSRRVPPSTMISQHGHRQHQWCNQRLPRIQSLSNTPLIPKPNSMLIHLAVRSFDLASLQGEGVIEVRADCLSTCHPSYHREGQRHAHNGALQPSRRGGRDLSAARSPPQGQWLLV